MAAGPVGAAVPLSKRIFDKYDFDGNGNITAAEFREMVYEMGYYLSDREMQMALLILDTNGDGMVNYNEFVAWWRTDDRFKKLHLSDEQYSLLQYCSTYFQYWDKDNDGVLNKEEFRPCYDDLVRNKVTESPFDRCFQTIDSSGEGLISFNEYIDWLIAIGSISLSSSSVTQVPATAVEEEGKRQKKTEEEKTSAKELERRITRATTVLKLTEQQQPITDSELVPMAKTLETIKAPVSSERLQRLETMREERFKQYRESTPQIIAKQLAQPGGEEAHMSRLRLVREVSEAHLLTGKKVVDKTCTHEFRRFKFHNPSFCDLCARRLYNEGLVGYRCRHCRYTVHDGECRVQIDPKKSTERDRRAGLRARIKARKSRSPAPRST